jgi:hypothetical protein
MEKEYYLAITQGNKVLETELLNDFLLRKDVVHIFKATYYKNTPKNIFYKIVYLKDKLPIEKPYSFELKGIKCTYNFGEEWLDFNKNISGKCLHFTIIDLLEIEKKVVFHNYPDKTSGLENYLNYLDDVLRLGSHQAVLEVKDLENKIFKLKSKLAKK